MIRKLIVCFLCLIPLNNISAFYGYVEMPEEVSLGDMFEMWIPTEGIETISGKFQDADLFFKQYDQKVFDYFPISRGRFLNEVIKNLGVTYERDLEGLPYTDVKPDDEYYDAILIATQLGIVSGREDGTFRPYAPIIRAEAAKIVVNAFELSATIEEYPNFPDLEDDDSLYEFIVEAYQAGIIKGFEDGLVRPKKDINYRQAEIIIDRAMGEDAHPDFDWDGSYYKSFVPVDRRGTAQEYNVELMINNDSVSTPISVSDVYFPSNHYNLPQSVLDLNNEERKEQTWEMIYSAIDSMSDNEFVGDDFEMPTVGTLTQGYGEKSYINGSFYGSHWGLDLANQTGTVVNATQDGVVILAAETPSYGGTIIIDHGEKISSVYLHLNSVDVAVGDIVNKGDPIATMGSTGISTGPHLHFSMMIGRVVTNPWLFLAE